MKEAAVYIIDDDPSARRGLSRLISAAGLHSESFGSAADFLASEKSDGPGCIVLDVRMPEMTGPKLQEELSKSEYCMPIIFISAHGDVPTTAQAMKKGAADFLTKPVDRDELLEAIRISLTRDTENRSQLEERSSLNEHIETLTPREHEVMTYVIAGMLNKQIAAELGISEETIKIHRRHVMHKLGITSVAELVRLCEHVGIEPVESNSK